MGTVALLQGPATHLAHLDPEPLLRLGQACYRLRELIEADGELIHAGGKLIDALRELIEADGELGHRLRELIEADGELGHRLREPSLSLGQFPHKDRSVFLVQGKNVPPLPNTVLQGPIYGVGIFREERTARTLAKRLAES